MNKAIFFHADCTDGILAAWLAKIGYEQEKWHDKVNAFPINYGDLEPIKQLTDTDYDSIDFVDFCPTMECIKAIVETLPTSDRRVLVINIFDHHTDNIRKFIVELAKQVVTECIGFDNITDITDSISGLNHLLTQNDVSVFHDNNFSFTDEPVRTYLEPLQLFNDYGPKITFNFTLNLNNYYSGASLVADRFLPSDLRYRLRKYLAYTHVNEGRELDHDMFPTFSKVGSSGRLLLQLIMHVTDADTFTWKFAKSKIFMLALKKKISDLNFSFEEVSSFLNNITCNEAAFNSLYEEGAMMEEEENIYIESKACPITWLTVEDNKYPVFVCRNSSVSKLSHYLTSNLEHKTVLIISGLTGNGFKTRVGSEDGSAQPLAVKLGGNGHPDASGCLLNAGHFLSDEYLAITTALESI